MKQQDNHIVSILSEFSSWCLCDDDSCDKSRNFDNSVRQIEDFYRNKILEAEYKALRRVTIGGKGGTELFVENVPIENRLNQLTAQFNSKEGK